MKASEALMKIYLDYPNGVIGCEQCEELDTICEECLTEKMEDKGFYHILFSN